MPKKVKNADYYRSFDDFDTFVKNVKIPEKKWKFFENFINEKSDTFGNAVNSYHAAGYAKYKTSRYSAKDLYNSPLIQTLLRLYHKKTAERRENRNISVFEWGDLNLLWAVDKARDRGDYMAVRAITMDRAKMHGILVEKHQVIDTPAQREIDHTKQIEASKLAERALLGQPPEMPQDVIEGVFETIESQECTEEVYKEEAEAALQVQNQ